MAKIKSEIPDKITEYHVGLLKLMDEIKEAETY